MEKIEIITFGFKFHKPEKNEIVFDLRKNVFDPFHIAGDKSGLDSEVSDIILKGGGNKKVEEIIEYIKNCPEKHLVVKIGCIGGRHRSVCVAERVKKIWEETINSSTIISVLHLNINN